MNEFSEYEHLGMFSLEELWMLGERGGLQEAVQEIWMSRDGVHNSFKNHYHAVINLDSLPATDLIIRRPSHDHLDFY